MTKKITNKLPDLIKKAQDTYNLLEKLPIGIGFYETYNKYRILAEEINNTAKLENVSPRDNSFESFATKSLFGYISFKIIPLIISMQNDKKVLFTQLPKNDDKYFENLLYHFGKLAKMQGDLRFEYWFSETDKLLNDFLDQIKTTSKGNELFLHTNFMNAMHEILDFVKLSKLQKKVETTSLESIQDSDIHGLVIKFNSIKPKEESSAISLKNKGGMNILSLYSDEKKTKEELMEPIHIFQSKVIDIKTPTIKPIRAKKIKLKTEQLPIEISENITFNRVTGKLRNSFGKESLKIKFQPLKLLNCFFTGNTKKYQCKKSVVIKVLGSESKHSGARRQLLSLLEGVANIEPIMNKENRRKVDYYKLVSVKK